MLRIILNLWLSLLDGEKRKEFTCLGNELSISIVKHFGLGDCFSESFQFIWFIFHVGDEKKIYQTLKNPYKNDILTKL